jgi:hypothetical protein
MPAPSQPLPASTLLVSELVPCILAGSDHPEIATGEPLSCLSIGGTWTRQVVADAAFDVHAELAATGFTLAPGEYTFVVDLDDATIQQMLGWPASRKLRSNPIRIVVGPPATLDEQLSALLRRAVRASIAGQFAEAERDATALLALYPQSVQALCIRAAAREGLGDIQGAITAYEAATAILESRGDTLANEFTHNHGVGACLQEIGENIDRLTNPPEEP